MACAMVSMTKIFFVVPLEAKERWERKKKFKHKLQKKIFDKKYDTCYKLVAVKH